MPKQAMKRDTSWDPSGVTPKQLQELGVASVQELQAAHSARAAARQALSDYLARPDVSGPDKQRARCAHTFKHGRLPYQCSGCWLLPGNCVCNRLRKAAPATRVIIHLHQDEWGRGSNTGCLCAGSLSGAQQLLRGYAPHDEQLAALLADPEYTTALLWPGSDALEPHELQELAAARSNGRITLVAIDATWGCAVKMRKKYPEGLLTVRLPPDLALPQLHHILPTAGPEAHSSQSSQQCSSQQGEAAGSVSAADITSSPQQQQQQQQQALGSSGQLLQKGCEEGRAGEAGSKPSSSGTGSAQAGVKGRGPKHIPKPGERVSLFRGMRKYHGKALDNGRVSTLEAVAAALLALEGDEETYRGLLHNLKLKVDAMRHQKHVPPMTAYGVAAAEEGDDGGGGVAAAEEEQEEEED